MRSAVGLHSVPHSHPSSPIVVACALAPHQRARLTDAMRKQIDVRVVALVAYCQRGSSHSVEIRSLAAAGVHQFVFEGDDDAGAAFRLVLEAAKRECAADCVMRRLAPVIPQALHRMTEAILTGPAAVTSIQALANELGVHRKTIFNRCSAAACISPAELLAWSRLALVGYLLETTGCTVERIAGELAYPSVTALRNSIRRYTGLSATAIRAGAGLSVIVDAIGRRIQARLQNKNGTDDLHLV
jgi:AraC-like DNA-binding protein